RPAWPRPARTRTSRPAPPRWWPRGSRGAVGGRSGRALRREGRSRPRARSEGRARSRTPRRPGRARARSRDAGTRPPPARSWPRRAARRRRSIWIPSWCPPVGEALELGHAVGFGPPADRPRPRERLVAHGEETPAVVGDGELGARHVHPERV